MRSIMLLCGGALLRLAGGPRPDRGGSGLRARPKPKEGFSFFLKLFLMQNNSRKIKKLFKGTKNTPKITKHSRKIPRGSLGHEQSK
jgi:hypothetical protein